MKYLPQILLLSLGHMGKVSRPTRLVRLLENFGHLTVMSPSTPYSGWHCPATHHIIFPDRARSLFNQIRRSVLLSLRKFENEIWDRSLSVAYRDLSGFHFDYIFCEDITLLPLALSLKNSASGVKKCKVVMDAREYYPLQFENRFIWKLFLSNFNDYLCKKYLSCADIIFTVSPGLIEAYKNQYNVSCSLLPSYSFYHNISPSPTGNSIRVIHHGLASKGRKIETMFEIASHLDNRFSVDFMLVPNEPRYYRRLQKIATDMPRVRILPPVPMPDIVRFVSQYDMGLCWFSPQSFNLRHCWPNKLFEFIQARLALAVAPLPDMATLVQERNLGVVATDYDALKFASRLNTLSSDDIDKFKENAHSAASDFCWERCEEIISTLLN